MQKHQKLLQAILSVNTQFKIDNGSLENRVVFIVDQLDNRLILNRKCGPENLATLNFICQSTSHSVEIADDLFYMYLFV